MRYAAYSFSKQSEQFFADSSGNAVLLVGSHTWTNFQDQGSTPSTNVELNFDKYTDWMKDNNQNFMRLWTYETPKDAAWMKTDWYYDPLPYQRTGPGLAADGKLKFDLTKFDQYYFDRLRERVIEAGQDGIYVSVMLFQGWSIGDVYSGDNPWESHPFNKNNNINNVNGDPNNDGSGFEIQTIAASSQIKDLQKAYVKKVIDTVNDLDNVLYEVSNEFDSASVSWQYDMIDYIKNYEATKPKQHPVGMTAAGGGDANLFASPADWISPNYGEPYRSNPPSNNGSKVILNDTDHLWGIGGDATWVWKSFTRGLNPIYMDDLKNTEVYPGAVWDAPDPFGVPAAFLPRHMLFELV